MDGNADGRKYGWMHIYINELIENQSEKSINTYTHTQMYGFVDA